MVEVETEQLSHQQLQELIEGKLEGIQSPADYWEVTQLTEQLYGRFKPVKVHLSRAPEEVKAAVQYRRRASEWLMGEFSDVQDVIGAVAGLKGRTQNRIISQFQRLQKVRGEEGVFGVRVLAIKG